MPQAFFDFHKSLWDLLGKVIIFIRRIFCFAPTG